ncbi:MAG: SufD family Fe-S cluster assembly protein [Bifidobacteriaceae bacterium]|jgi:Fe-S cluster assembly protein SufD|nr:SufD family Fe-S cluster assembly protein [Bifidobacteriaceae bacterium]
MKNILVDNMQIQIYELTNSAKQIAVTESILQNEKKTIYIFVFGPAKGLDLKIELNEPNSEINIFCLYIVVSKVTLKFNLEVFHNAKNCKSNILYKGVLLGENSQVFWNSNVVINSPAKGTDTYEANKNMILAKGAKAYSVPNLEILQGDIKGAGHASAIGRFDQEQLFYLMSRGLSDKQAKRVLVEGFAIEILENLPLEAQKDKYINKIMKLLN